MAKYAENGEYLPETFEEWVEIHGEPEYLYERSPTNGELDIEILDCDEEEPPVDTDGILYTNQKGILSINYALFTEVFAQANRCVYCNGLFFTPDGSVSAATMRQDIQLSLMNGGWTSRLDAPTNSLLASLQNYCHREKLEVDENIIPFANGDLHLQKHAWSFHLGEKKQCPYRLSVAFSPVDKPMPLFEKWLHDVFEDEDIPTIQEIMGYCLVPVTAAQEAFFLVGDGEVGKSVIGKILQSIIGGAFQPVSTQDLVTKRFQISVAENKLVVYDDDLGSAALTETGTLKKLITADQPIPAERKFADPYKFQPFCKVLGCANFMLSSLYDDSDGFYRRLHPIHVKRKDPNRRIIRNFGELVSAEREQITRWALIGLKRLMANHWEVTWSQRSRDYMGVVKSNGVHFQEFLSEVTDQDEKGDVSSAELRQVYERWCKANSIQDAKLKRMQNWLSDNAERLSIHPTAHVKRDGRDVRGYRGIRIKGEWRNVIVV